MIYIRDVVLLKKTPNLPSPVVCAWVPSITDIDWNVQKEKWVARIAQTELFGYNFETKSMNMVVTKNIDRRENLYEADIQIARQSDYKIAINWQGALFEGVDEGSKFRLSWPGITEDYYEINYAIGNGRQLIANFDVDAAKISGSLPFVVKFLDRSTGQPDSYSWDFGDGGSSDQPNPTHTYGRRGAYTVTLMVQQGEQRSQVSKDALIDVKLPECKAESLFWTELESEETDDFASCPDGYVMSGVKCNSSDCDNVQLQCCQYLDGEDTESVLSNWSRWFSEEGINNRYPIEGEGPGWIVAVQCKGWDCDEMRVKTITTPNLTQTKTCEYIPGVSEEQQEDESKGRCPEGWYAAGLKCTDDYCGTVSVMCCQGE